MRELTLREVSQVGGGVGPGGAIIGGVTAGISAASNGNGVGIIVGAVLIGATAGFFGAVAAAAPLSGALMFGTYSVGTGVLAGHVASDHRN